MSKKAAGKVEESAVIPLCDANHFVRLISMEGTTYFVDKNCARTSRSLKHVLAPSAVPGVTKSQMSPSGLFGDPCVRPPDALGTPAISLDFLPDKLLEEAVRFMYYKYRYDHELVEARPPFKTALSHPEQLALATLLGL